VQVCRISSRSYASEAFSGEGASLEGGRWNPIGSLVVYTSASLSLAALEYFTNLEIEDPDISLVAVSAEIPQSVQVASLSLGELPANWRVYPAPRSTRDLGAQWLAAGRSAVLSVPSVLIPAERNYLLNPIHPEFRKIVIHKPEPFSFDPRMWKAGR